MAKSTGYFGLRRGSTKSHTFSVMDGKQITKDRVEGGKNPRTVSQMSQRCILATIGSAYSAMKVICDHSFEGKTAGRQCMSEFMHANLRQAMLTKDSGFYGFNNYGEKGLVAGSYIVSDGSLPVPAVDMEIASVNTANKRITIAAVIAETVAEIAADLGMVNFGDICTFTIMYPKKDGFYGFGAVRLTYKQGESVADSFAVEKAGDVVSASISVSGGKLNVVADMYYEFATSASTSNTYAVAVLSRKVNGNWLRSKAQFDVTDATPTFAAALSTYPVGQERFLNGDGIVTPAAGGNTGGGGGDTGGGDDNGGGSGEDDH